MFIKVLKLVTGEDIICECEFDEHPCERTKDETADIPNYIFVRYALLLFQERNQNGKQVRINFIQWNAYTEDPISVITKDKVVAVIEPSDDIEKAYINICEEMFNVSMEHEREMLENDSVVLESEEDWKNFMKLVYTKTNGTVH